MPVTPTTAPAHRPIDPLDDVFTIPASLTGAPAVVVPTGMSDGLAVAVQIVGPRWRDDLALRCAMAIEGGP